jgi:hypothetical protein
MYFPNLKFLSLCDAYFMFTYLEKKQQKKEYQKWDKFNNEQ